MSQTHHLGPTKDIAMMLLTGSVLRHSLPIARCQELLGTPTGNADQPKRVCAGKRYMLNNLLMSPLQTVRAHTHTHIHTHMPPNSKEPIMVLLGSHTNLDGFLLVPSLHFVFLGFLSLSFTKKSAKKISRLSRQRSRIHDFDVTKLS